MVDEKGKPRSPSEIKKNIQNITFASHCHGSFMAYQIEKMMAEKLTELYPDQMKDLMENVRMIHFASRRPKGQTTYGKHLDIISRRDASYADSRYLEYDNIYKQIHRTYMGETALIPVSPNEEILLLEKMLLNDSFVIGADPDHTGILHIFSGEQTTLKNGDGEVMPLNPRNAPVIQLARQLFRHFVEHPDDTRNLSDQIRGLNPDLVDKNTERGKAFLTQEKEAEKVRRGVLSLVTDWGARLARRGKNSDDDHNGLLCQRDDEGRFLLEELEKRYLQTGERSSLMNYIKDVREHISNKDMGNLAIMAIQHNDWILYGVLGRSRKEGFKVGSKAQLEKIVALIRSEDLYRLIPFLNTHENRLREYPNILFQVVKKAQQVRNVIHKKQLGIFLSQTFFTDEKLYKTFLKQVSMKGKKSLKNLLSDSRITKRDSILSSMRKRDQEAPDLTIKDILEARRYLLSIEQYREFKTQKKENPELQMFQFQRALLGKKAPK